jgi:glycosyltransferase involved in cell wall biosynthesis
MSAPHPACFALIATKDRWPLLAHGALTSIRDQSHQPDAVIVVNDGHPFSSSDLEYLRALLGPTPLTVLANRKAPGPAGAWNTGLEYIGERWGSGFVAFLDDDDTWCADHLGENLRAAAGRDAAIVVSGLRMLRDGLDVPRELPSGLTPRDFLIGNPGWQGSNTFARFDVLCRVGGFRHGMPSLNDRDLAIRLLRLPNIRVAYTGRWTASWNTDHGRLALSTPRSREKVSGLRWFWHLYGEEMSEANARQYFERAERLFKVGRSEIVDAGDDLPPHREPRGDLLAAAAEQFR